MVCFGLPKFLLMLTILLTITRCVQGQFLHVDFYFKVSTGFESWVFCCLFVFMSVSFNLTSQLWTVRVYVLLFQLQHISFYGAGRQKMNRSSANHSRDMCSRMKGRGSVSEKVAVIGVKLMCQMCFLQHSLFVKYVNKSRGDVTQLEPHALQPDAKTNESSKWLDRFHK